MRTLTTTAALAALAWLSQVTPAGAQEATIEEALEYLQLEKLPEELPEGARRWLSPSGPAVQILRQVSLPRLRGRFESDPRPAAELDAFADRLAELAADASLPEHVRRNASGALLSATASKAEHRFGGTPYARAFDLLVQVYESGYDKVLYSIWLADSVRGRAYLKDVFERSERPPLCRWDYESGRNEPLECVRGFHTFHETPWCRAGRILYSDTVRQAEARTPSDRLVRGAGEPAPVPEGLPEHVQDWHRRCAR